MATAIYQFPFPTQLKRLVDPTDPQDAATKAYVDAQSGGSTSYDFGVVGQNVLNTNQLSLQMLPYDFGVFNPPSERYATQVISPYNQGVVLDLGSF